MTTPIYFYKTDSLSNLKPNSLVALKLTGGLAFSLWVTDKTGIPYPLKDDTGGGGGGTIEDIINTDGNLTITGTTTKTINVSSSLLLLINSALQAGDNISSLTNDENYITLADIPAFVASDYDLEDFTNAGVDPYAHLSDLSTGITNLDYISSSTQGTVTSDTGTDAIIPLADVTNAGLLSPEEKIEISTALQLGDNISSLINDSNYATEIYVDDGLDTKIDSSLLSESAIIGTIPLRKLDGRVETGTAVDGADAINKTQFDSGLGNKADLVDGKVPLTQINDALLGSVNYKGTYNATTNVPTIPTATSSNKGWYYVVSTAGTQQGFSFVNGDWFISNGTSWGKVDNNNNVTSVNGQVGAVTIIASGLGAEITANKSSSYTASSTTTYPDTKALVDGLATKQNTLTNPITGTGTVGTVSKFTGSNTLGNSFITEDSNSITLKDNYKVWSKKTTSFSATAGTYANQFSYTPVSGNIGGAFFIQMTVGGTGISLSKQYLVNYSYNATGVNWQMLTPISSTGAYSGEDIVLDININNFVMMVRARRVSGTNVAIITLNVSTVLPSVNYVLVDESGTGTGATVTGNFAGTSLTQVGGRVLISTNVDDNVNALQVNGSTKTTALTLTTSPTTSASTYNPLTWNTSTGVVEKITAIPQSLVTNLTTNLAAKAPLASPAFTGTPTAPTAAPGTNTTQIATMAALYAATTTELAYALADETANLTVSTRIKFRMPFAMTLSEVRISLNDAPTLSSVVVDVKENGVSIFSTLLSIDANEKTSVTAATPAVISDVNLADDAEITVSTTQIGSGDTGKGLKILFKGRKA